MKWNPGNDVSNPGFRSAPSRLRLLGVQQYRINGLGQRVAKIHGKSTKRTGSGDDADDDEDGEHHKDAHQGKAKGVQKAAAGTYFVYDEAGHLLGEYNQTGKAIQETVWLGDMPVAVLKKHQAYYVYADHLNTPRAISDRKGQVVWRWDSDPFGVGLAVSGQKSTEHDADEDPDHDEQALVYNLRFPGQYYDSETGLHYNTFRDYDPATGRYIQSDPIGLSGGLNTYAYVGSNPVNWTDTLGLDPLCATDGSQKIACADGMRPPPEGTPLNGPLSPVGIAATAGEIGLLLVPEAKGASVLAKCPSNGVTKYAVDDFAEVAGKISQKQMRHITGRNEYRGGGYLNSLDDAQNVLDAYRSGSTTIIGKSKQGFPIVKYEGVTGTNVNVGAGISNVSAPKSAPQLPCAPAAYCASH